MLWRNLQQIMWESRVVKWRLNLILTVLQNKKIQSKNFSLSHDFDLKLPSMLKFNSIFNGFLELNYWNNTFKVRLTCAQLKNWYIFYLFDFQTHSFRVEALRLFNTTLQYCWHFVTVVFLFLSNWKLSFIGSLITQFKMKWDNVVLLIMSWSKTKDSWFVKSW